MTLIITTRLILVVFIFINHVRHVPSATQKNDLNKYETMDSFRHRKIDSSSAGLYSKPYLVSNKTPSSTVSHGSHKQFVAKRRTSNNYVPKNVYFTNKSLTPKPQTSSETSSTHIQAINPAVHVDPSGNCPGKCEEINSIGDCTVNIQCITDGF